MQTGMFFTITAVGVQQASGVGSSAAINLPLCASGEAARYVRVSATAAACIVFGKTTAVATVNHAQIQPGDSAIFCVQGYDKFAVIQVTAGGLVQVSPLENM